MVKENMFIFLQINVYTKPLLHQGYKLLHSSSILKWNSVLLLTNLCGTYIQYWYQALLISHTKSYKNITVKNTTKTIKYLREESCIWIICKYIYTSAYL
jgi:hypothetical protein